MTQGCDMDCGLKTRRFTVDRFTGEFKAILVCNRGRRCQQPGTFPAEITGKVKNVMKSQIMDDPAKGDIVELIAKKAVDDALGEARQGFPEE